jgi:hypothetical protein
MDLMVIPFDMTIDNPLLKPRFRTPPLELAV